MAKRNFAPLVSVLVIGLLAAAVRAAPIPIPVAVDGCAKLARVIYTEVSAAALHGSRRSGPWTINLGQGDLAVCEHAAKTVSRAFTSAISSAGISLSWGPDDDRNGDYCWGGFLSQCYPNHDRLGYSMAGTRTSFVDKSWSAVSRAVMREMYNPFSSDEVRFRDDDLRLRLGLALRSIERFDGR